MSQIKLAEAQLTGFALASKGFTIRDLAESMGLTKKEWLAIKGSKFEDLKDSDKLTLDALFGLCKK